MGLREGLRATESSRLQQPETAMEQGPPEPRGTQSGQHLAVSLLMRDF